MDRIHKLCAYLDKCKTFADLGCDHGYCTRFMLENGMCESAVISDISAKCLSKAEKLLAEFVNMGKVDSVCCDGLNGIPENTEHVLIAGMGGVEIENILKTAYIPQSFVLQPMKNVKRLREFLQLKQVEITADEVFKADGKYYFVIKGNKKGVPCRYSRAELVFGKNLQSAETREYINSELEKKRSYLKRPMTEGNRGILESDVAFIEGVLKGEID